MSMILVHHKRCGCAVEWDCGCVSDSAGRHIQFGDLAGCIVCGTQAEARTRPGYGRRDGRTVRVPVFAAGAALYGRGRP
jgi:hypothetical protein